MPKVLMAAATVRLANGEDLVCRAAGKHVSPAGRRRRLDGLDGAVGLALS